jgi:hypothetical protein
VLPSDWLRNIALIDTPGTNALLSRHDELTQLIVPRADLVLFVTSAERPMSESEIKFLERISQWGKKVHVVLNKMDVLQNDVDKAKVIEFVRAHVSTRLKRQNGESVPVFPVSARMALQAKLRVDDGDSAGLQAMPEWGRSGVGVLEQHLRSVLSSEALVSSKLGNPLSVCDRLVAGELLALSQRQESLVADVRTVELIRENTNAFSEDVRRDVQYVQAQLNSLVAKHKAALTACVDEHVSVSNLAYLLDMRQFESQLSGASASGGGGAVNMLQKPLEDAVVDISGLVASRSHAQAAAVIRYVGDRHAASEQAKRFVGQGGQGTWSAASMAQFDKAGRDLRDRMLRQCAAVFAKSQAAHEESVSSAVRAASTAFSTVVGLNICGILGLTATAMQAVDMQLGLAVSVLPGLLSYFVIPSARNAIKLRFSVVADRLQRDLSDSLTDTLELELRTVREQIASSVAPYERFVAYETRTTGEMVVQLERVRQRTRDIRSSLEKVL